MDAPERLGGERKRSPPIKILSSQLREGKCTGSKGNMICTVKRRQGSTLPVSMVWMQGTVLDVHLERNDVTLLDETGTFTVLGVNNIPKGKPCLLHGKYVMVMGVIEAIVPEPVIRAVKIADLSKDAALHRKMWKLEVEDLQHLLP